MSTTSAPAPASASPLQLAANRANAAFSTGPSTSPGKLASSRNALSHGLTTADALLPFEDPGAYATHHQSRTDHYHPRDPIARSLVTELADLEWRLRRVPAFEAQLLTSEYRKLTTDPELAPLVRNLESEAQILALAFTRLVESKVLPNLLSQESRLARRAEKIRRCLEMIALQPPPPRQTPSEPQIELQSEIEIENCKNEPNLPEESDPSRPIHRAAPKIGRNESCPCGSGLKFKRCCLNKSRALNTA